MSNEEKSLMFLLALNFYNFIMTFESVIKSAIKKNNQADFFSSVLGFSISKVSSVIGEIYAL